MFGNVGRRVSNLTTRQLALIDAVERGETDPALLERLYSIDHIAVRLRRNADSLMLLAGIRETVLDAGPTELTNVVRAALGQIEGFQRVQLRAATEALVEPDIIGDLTLMIAELLENAVSFSPEGSPVEVVVGSDADGASITVADHGLGMSAERLAEENSASCAANASTSSRRRCSACSWSARWPAAGTSTSPSPAPRAAA